MKKKITALCLCIAMVAIAIVGASLAYFTDTKTAANTFTLGNVKIALDEADINGGESRVTSNSYTVMPGAEYPKDPIVHNTGANSAYIRGKVTVADWTAELAKYFPDYQGELKDSLTLLVKSLNTGWTVESASADANGNVTFVLKYADVLAKGASTPAMFNTVTIPTAIKNGDDFGTITVVAEAIQSDSFNSWDKAFEAYDAQQ